MFFLSSEPVDMVIYTANSLTDNNKIIFMYLFVVFS